MQLQTSTGALITVFVLVGITFNRPEFFSSSVWAGCGIDGGRVSIVGNEFPAIQAVGSAAAECAGGGVEVTKNLTADHQKINVQGMTGNPAEYTTAIIANSSIVALMVDDVIRPLDDLVAKHGQDILKHQLEILSRLT